MYQVVVSRSKVSRSLTALAWQLRLLSWSALRLFRYLVGRDRTPESLLREGKGCESLSKDSSAY